MSYSSYSSNTSNRSWVEKLEDYQIVSDRRGGRTAWSSTVTVQGQTIPARYWYDGQYVKNAKEDAAEVALKQIEASSPSSPSQSRSGWC
ncbi:hypothetical protein M7I_4087 [Glarea lozoyensis 74030]|uniref:DRBM domain-containing protein n=1 Tax=Glarea lozoyensis (strain ATCC 74030 / MF5533) TaxID=1104152 RepID=H0EN84_GLAL7|nr:hypothetical protein M7I_4087 [Glarea lozoyensis 74030]